MYTTFALHCQLTHYTSKIIQCAVDRRSQDVIIANWHIVEAVVQCTAPAKARNQRDCVERDRGNNERRREADASVPNSQCDRERKHKNVCEHVSTHAHVAFVVGFEKKHDNQAESACDPQRQKHFPHGP